MPYIVIEINSANRGCSIYSFWVLDLAIHHTWHQISQSSNPRRQHHQQVTSLLLLIWQFMHSIWHI